MVTKIESKRKINFRMPPDVYRKAEELAARLGVSLNDVFTLAVSVYLATERKAAKEPKLHSDFLGKRNIFAVMDGTIPQPSALAAKEPKP